MVDQGKGGGGKGCTLSGIHIITGGRGRNDVGRNGIKPVKGMIKRSLQVKLMLANSCWQTQIGVR